LTQDKEFCSNTFDQIPKEVMASKRFSLDGRITLWKEYMFKDPMENSGSNAPSTWHTTSPTRSLVDVGMEQVAT